MSQKELKQEESRNLLPQQRKQLQQKIERQKQMIKKIQARISEFDHKIYKVSESNARNVARKHRHRARLQQLQKCKDKPELLLAHSGVMNEQVQAFMLSHNFQMNVDVRDMNPDNMSYQQLIELGQKIGKVSKGLSKQQIDTLDHIKNKKKGQQCPICCSEFQVNQIGISLRCKHIYHEECIIEWLKDENRCPICKLYVLKQKQE